MNITVVRNKNKHLKKKKTGQGELNFSEGKELMSSGLIYISLGEIFKLAPFNFLHVQT